MRKFFSNSLRRRALFFIGVVLVALGLARPQAERVRWRVSQSISMGIGKRVQIRALHLRFLPLPGFELDDFAIYDDPSFGSEPLLRAQEVTAALRMTSLLRGRFEISSLSLNNASLNLTRESTSRWNLEDLLERTSQISTAPTASGNRESRPHFPYIEASRARINFKIGAEKTHFALTDAEFALWQESENMWGMRLKGQPIRTDANLTDTGVINVTGSWRRGESNQTPIEIAFQWKQAQAGQISKLITGEDKGWRGGLLISAAISGTTRNLKISADASIEGLGRYNVLSNDALDLAAHCVANYNPPENSVSDLDCASPVGNGYVELKGSANGPGLLTYGLMLTTSKVPAESLLRLLRHNNASIPDKLNVSGFLNSSIAVERTAVNDGPQWKADGELIELALTRSDSSEPVLLDRVPFSLVPGSQDRKPSINIGPVDTTLGRPFPLRAQASISASGFQASIHGGAAVKRLLQLASAFAIPAPAVNADGPAAVDVAISGNWSDKTPLVTGSAQLRNVHAQVRGLNAPLEIRSANLTLTSDSVRVQNITAVAADTEWRGSMLLPRPCPTPRDCTLQLNLHASEVSASSLNNLLNPSARKGSWYKFLSFGEQPKPYFLQAHATGNVSIEKLIIGDSTLTQASGTLMLDQGKLTVTGLHAAGLGGKINGEWKADFTAKPPVYAGKGDIESISLDQVSDLMRDDWAEGHVSAQYEFKTAGWSLQDLLASADFKADFALKDASFTHVALTPKSNPLRIKSFEGRLGLQDGSFSFQDAKLSGPDGIYTVSGTASLSGALKLKLIGAGMSGYEVSGTLTRTRVSQLAATSARASLKP